MKNEKEVRFNISAIVTLDGQEELEHKIDVVGTPVELETLLQIAMRNSKEIEHIIKTVAREFDLVNQVLDMSKEQKTSTQNNEKN